LLTGTPVKALQMLDYSISKLKVKSFVGRACWLD